MKMKLLNIYEKFEGNVVTIVASFKLDELYSSDVYEIHDMCVLVRSHLEYELVNIEDFDRTLNNEDLTVEYKIKGIIKQKEI